MMITNNQQQQHILFLINMKRQINSIKNSEQLNFMIISQTAYVIQKLKSIIILYILKKRDIIRKLTDLLTANIQDL